MREIALPTADPLTAICGKEWRFGKKPKRRRAEKNNKKTRTKLPERVAGERFIHINQIRVNGRIRAREVRVIIAATNEQLGVLKTPDALRKAQSLGLDLVEVAPNAIPPVCRIVDFGKFRYELSKQEKEKKQVSGKLKEIKFGVNIDGHDYLTKVRHAEEFLFKGNKVKVLLQFRGRQMAHQDLGMNVVLRVRDDLATMSQIEMQPRQQGRTISMTLAPLPEGKRKRKFAPPEEEYVEDEADESSED